MLFSALFLLSSLHNVVAQRHDADLMSFVTLPEVRALKWDVHYHDRARAEPGYWFVAPYGQINPELATKKYQQYQVGPYIYDDNGMLIWAGSLFWDNQNVFDFRAVHDLSTDNDTHISMIVNWERDGPSKGKGVMMNKHYHVETEVNVLNDLHDFNMHEFNILPGGKTALACTYRTREISMVDFGRPAETSFIVSGGFVELDMETSEILVQWESFDHVPLHESNMFHAWDNPMGDPGWDYVHINAVDKNAAGDYIISLRFTNTIYGISGEDGRIMWRLGGLESDFDMDFTFSKQHDVKFVSSNGTHHVISMLNNASDERGNDENLSSALFIEMDTISMTARVINRVNRPDSDLTRLRGSVSTLANGNIFIGWSEFGYQSEHAPNGDLLMTSRFVGDRYSTYRAYKSDFVGRPTAPPDVVASVYGTSEEDITTIIYVSWNGATDVVGWNFYAQAYDRGEPVKIGHANKTDFETMYIVDGYMDWITAEALDINGNVMKTSRMARSDIPPNWKAAGFQGESGPSPDDPSIIASVNKGTGSTSSSESTSSTDTESTDAVEADKTVADTTDTTENTETTDSSSGMDGMDMSDDSTSDSMDHDSSSYADAKEVAKAVYKAYEVIRGVGGLLIFILLSCSIGGALYSLWRCHQARKRRSYHHVPSEEGVPVEEIHLRSQHPE